MKVWIDQDLCTCDGLCEEISPAVFILLSDLIAYVKEDDKVFATSHGNPQGAAGKATVHPANHTDVREAAHECSGNCIFIEEK